MLDPQSDSLRVRELAQNLVTPTEPGSERTWSCSANEFERLRGTNIAWFAFDELTYCDQEAWLRTARGCLRHPLATKLSVSRLALAQHQALVGEPDIQAGVVLVAHPEGGKDLFADLPWLVGLGNETAQGVVDAVGQSLIGNGQRGVVVELNCALVSSRLVALGLPATNSRSLSPRPRRSISESAASGPACPVRKRAGKRIPSRSAGT